MNDDVTPSTMQSIREGADGLWTYYDMDEAEYTASRKEVIAFYHGRATGAMMTRDEIDWQCGVYDRNGKLIDTLVYRSGV